MRPAPWLTALVLVGSGPVLADAFPLPEVPYSADVTLRTGSPEAEEPDGVGRVWYADGKRRRELRLGDVDALVIEREDLGVRWSRLPGTTMFSELPIGRSARGTGPDPVAAWRGEVTLEPGGVERVNGVDAYRYEVKAKGGGGTAWLTRDRIPVRYEGTLRQGGQRTRLRMDYTNIRVGPQDAALFELPAGVKPIPAMPIATHGPGADREGLQEELRQQVEEIRREHGKQGPQASQGP